MSRNKIRVGIDIGGTFTDVVLASNSQLHTTKILTTHDAPDRAIMQGLQDVMGRQGCRSGEVELLIHGTTLATNALIERKGARTAMLTTAGFLDVLEMGTESRFDQYDLKLSKPAPLVPASLRFPVHERLAADGSVLLPLDPGSFAQLAASLQEQEIESVAICFLHSYVNADHEQRAADEIRKHLPDISLSLSSEVAPEIREYERFSTTVANAYVQPLIDNYLQGLAGQLAGAGFTCPLYIFLSNGGLAEVEVARRFPIRLVESGPAGGAVFASDIARRHQRERILSFDMGGTTAKICLIDKAEPQKANVFEMARVHRYKQGSGLPVRIPVIEMIEIGAGGGSIARVDSLERIAVGPDSAGSRPGPACYKGGGSEVTVTDADLVLGRLESDGFADGSMQLDREAAGEAIQHHLARPLAMAVPTAAWGVTTIVEEDMASAAREHAAESGKSLADRTLVAFGGAAPLHALSLADKLGIERVIIPPSAGVGSAIGFLLAPVAFEQFRSCRLRLVRFEARVLNELAREMSDYAHGVVASGAGDYPRSEIRQLQMRYVGQGYSIGVDLPVRELQADDAMFIRAAFDAAYAGLYSKLQGGIEVEIVGIGVSVSARIADAEQGDMPAVIESRSPPIDHRSTMFNERTGAYEAVDVYLRSSLRAGDCLDGPALLRDTGTTLMLPAGYKTVVAADHSLLVEKRPVT